MNRNFRIYKNLNFRYLNIKDSDYENLNDFEQRDLMIKFFENKLHVIFSYVLLFKIISFISIGLSYLLYVIDLQQYSYIFLILSPILLLISLLLNEKYKNIVMYYKLSLNYFNSKLEFKYKFKFPEI